MCTHQIQQSHPIQMNINLIYYLIHQTSSRATPIVKQHCPITKQTNPLLFCCVCEKTYHIDKVLDRRLRIHQPFALLALLVGESLLLMDCVVRLGAYTVLLENNLWQNLLVFVSDFSIVSINLPVDSHLDIISLATACRGINLQPQQYI